MVPRGREDLIERCAYRLTTPGIGREAGASLYSLLEMYQGLFLAPHVVGEAVKGAVYTAGLLGGVQRTVYPCLGQPPH